MSKRMFPLFLLLAMAPASAQVREKLTAKIPFEFVAGERVFPAGEYIFKRGAPPAALVIRGRHLGWDTAIVKTGVAPQPALTAPELIFNRFGDHYFLARILWPAEGAHKLKRAPQPEVTIRIQYPQ